MNYIDNSADTIDIRDIIERVEELREPRFVAGRNMPGYMPDSEPAEFDDADDAKRSIIEDIKRAEEEADSEELAEALAAFAEDVNLTDDEFSLTGPDGLVYWVTEDGTMGLDDDETAELARLEELLSNLEDYSRDHQWEGSWYPVTLIRDTYFQDYAKELADDIGAIPANAGWPCNCIDWEQAARDLQTDYSSAEYDGVTYWYR